MVFLLSVLCFCAFIVLFYHGEYRRLAKDRAGEERAGRAAQETFLV